MPKKRCASGDSWRGRLGGMACLTGAATDVNVAGKSKSAFLASACFSGYWLVGEVLSLAKQNQEKGQLADCYQAAAQSLYPHVSEKAV